MSGHEAARLAAAEVRRAAARLRGVVEIGSGIVVTEMQQTRPPKLLGRVETGLLPCEFEFRSYGPFLSRLDNSKVVMLREGVTGGVSVFVHDSALSVFALAPELVKQTGKYIEEQSTSDKSRHAF